MAELFDIDAVMLREFHNRGTLRVRAEMPGPTDIGVASRDRMLKAGLIEATEVAGLYRLTPYGEKVHASPKLVAALWPR